MTIQELCKERKTALGYTHQDIADRSGVPLQTVRNFFSSASKAPSIYTAAQIRAVLGVSLDEYFGISEQLTTEEKHMEDLQAQISTQKAIIDDLNRRGRTYRRAILFMSLAIAILVAWCIYFDVQCMHIGFWRE